MVHASYICDNNIYTVESVDTYDTIEEDAIKATADVDGIDIKKYMNAMKKSVYQKLAYHIIKNGVVIGLIYNTIMNDKYTGNCVYCKGDIVGAMVLFKTMSEITPYHKMYILPHTGGLKYFLSQATASSIKSYHIHKTPIIICKSLEEVYAKLFTYLHIEKL